MKSIGLVPRARGKTKWREMYHSFIIGSWRYDKYQDEIKWKMSATILILCNIKENKNTELCGKEFV